jgi:hypothetical protein
MTANAGVYPLSAGMYGVKIAGQSFLKHVVDDAGTCSCGDVNCPAVAAVQEHIKNGGEPARPARHDFVEVVPRICPICAAGVDPFPSFNSKTYGAGWVCKVGGQEHYWQHRAYLLRGQVEKLL